MRGHTSGGGQPLLDRVLAQQEGVERKNTLGDLADGDVNDPGEKEESRESFDERQESVDHLRRVVAVLTRFVH